MNVVARFFIPLGVAIALLVASLPISVVAQNIPYNPDFPDAEYPYAKAPDGCSSWSDNPKQVRDTWGSVDFRPACNEHDRCYYTYGSSWNQCNEQYLLDLSSACWNDLRIPVVNPFTGETTAYLPPEPVSLSTCYSIALIYYTAVQTGVALGVFEEAQQLQKQYDKWVASLHDNAETGLPCQGGPIYVNAAYDSIEHGSMSKPFKALQTAYEAACAGAQIRISAGTFSGEYVFNKPITLIAENGIVVIGN